MDTAVDIKDFQKVLGENLRTRRIECRMTQEKLAQNVGVTQEYVSQLENGQREPSVKILLKLAIALRTTHQALTTEGSFSKISA